MSDPLQIVFEDTPQLWRAYYDPEGIQGFGKTREAARMDLLEQTDERWSEALEKNVRHLARIAELEGLLSQGSFSLEARTAETLDAERYRYLRNVAMTMDDAPSIVAGATGEFDFLEGPRADEHVDEAIKEWRSK